MRGWRFWGSVAAVVVGVAICLHQRHFSVSVMDPMSFVRMLRHKCGMLMAGAVVWMVVEAAVGLAGWGRGWVAKGGRGVPSVLRG